MSNKLCKECGGAFEVVRSRGNHRYCAECRPQVRRLSHRAATQKYDDKRREEKAKRPKLVACIDCGIGPVLRHAQRKRCEKCRIAARNKRSGEYAPIWRARNPEWFKQRQAKWRASNQAKIQEYYDREKAHGLRRQWGHKTRATKSGSPGVFTPGEWNLLLWIFDYHCAYCLKPSKRLTVDHVIPLERGGSNFIENILPACFSCNSNKRYRTEWRNPHTGELLRVMPLGALPNCGIVEAVN